MSVEFTYTIKLTHDEAQRLRDWVQNPHWSCPDPAMEDFEDAQLRRTLFDQIPHVVVRTPR